MNVTADAKTRISKRRARRLWLWIPLSVLGLLILTPFVAGRFMPRDFAGRGEVTIPRPIEEVWAAIQDSARFPVSAGMSRSSERLTDEDGRATWREDLGSSQITYRVVEQTPPVRRVVEGRDAVVPMTLRSTCELTAVEGGTRVSAEHRIHLDDGTWHVPVFRFMLGITGGAQSGAEAYLRSLEGAGTE